MSPVQARLQALAAALLFSTGAQGSKLQPSQDCRFRLSGPVSRRSRCCCSCAGRLVWSLQVVAGRNRLRGHAHVVRVVDETDDGSERDLSSVDGAALSAPARPAPAGRALQAPRSRLPGGCGGRDGRVVSWGSRTATRHRARSGAAETYLAVACSITWAFTLVALRYVERDHSRPGLGMSAVALGNLFASVAALPFAWPLPCSVDRGVGDDRVSRCRARSDSPMCA